MNLSGNPSRRRAAFLASRARGGGRIAPIARRTVVVALRAGGNRAERQQDSCQVRRRPRPPADANACPPVLGKSKCKLDRLPYIYGQGCSEPTGAAQFLSLYSGHYVHFLIVRFYDM